MKRPQVAYLLDPGAMVECPYSSCHTLVFMVVTCDMNNTAQRRYGVLPTMHCFQWDILYRWSYGAIAMKTCLKCKIRMRSINEGMFHHNHSN